MNILLRRGKLIDPSQDMEGYYDVLIRGGKIAEIGKDLGIDSAEDLQIIDLDGKYVVPGLIDMHVHFRDPGFEEKETIITGAEAAAAGGFTTVVCMPNTKPVIDSVETINYIKNKAEGAACNVLMMGSITEGLNGELCSPYEQMKSNGIVGITDDGKTVMNSGVLYSAMLKAKELDLPVSSHCEDSNLTFDRTINEGETASKLGVHGVPSIAEELIIGRDILLAEETGVRLHIQHISSRKGVDLVRQAKARGIRVTAEAAPHHFSLTEEAVLTHGTNAKMSPPLRTSDDVEAVIEGLVDGTIDVIADDHAPHTEAEKDSDIVSAPNGIIGLETTLALSIDKLVNQGHLSLSELIKKLTVNPAGILNIDKGHLREGGDADITVIDLDREWTVDSSAFKSKARNTPFEGMKLQSKNFMTICGGKIVYKGDQPDV